jgi:hypothetical protein
VCSHIGAAEAVWSVATKPKLLASSSFQPFLVGIILIGHDISRHAVTGEALPEKGAAMRLVDNLRKAEEKGVMRIRRGMDRAREEWADVERRIRQRMRIYPHKKQAAAGAGSVILDQDVPQHSSGEQRRPIITIRGQDLN